jgi:hypothetical protein
LGIWVDNAASYGIHPSWDDDQSWAWGAEIEDLDNDGLGDVIVGYGPNVRNPVPPYDQPDEIYRNLGNGVFDRVAEAWGAADRLSMRGFVATDIDHDGWPDLVKREMGGRVVVYASRCGAAHWLEVELQGPRGNARAVGATVRVEVDGVPQVRPIVAGSTGYNSSGPAVAHFGLGEADRVDSVVVAWPDGEVTHHPGSPGNRRITIQYEADAASDTAEETL